MVDLDIVVAFAADRNEAVRRIAGAVEEVAIGGAHRSRREPVHPCAVGETLRQFGLLAGNPPALFGAEQPCIARFRAADIQGAHDAEDLNGIIAVVQQLLDRVERGVPVATTGAAGKRGKLSGHGSDSLLTRL